jgi:hypothetical protein
MSSMGVSSSCDSSLFAVDEEALLAVEVFVRVYFGELNK